MEALIMVGHTLMTVLELLKDILWDLCQHVRCHEIDWAGTKHSIRSDGTLSVDFPAGVTKQKTFLSGKCRIRPRSEHAVIIVSSYSGCYPQSYLTWSGRGCWIADFTVSGAQRVEILIGRLSEEGKALVEYYRNSSRELAKWNEGNNNLLPKELIYRGVPPQAGGQFPGMVTIDRFVIDPK
jgi:hypothetical protein